MHGVKGPSKKAETLPGHHREGFAKLARRSDISSLRDGILTLTDATGKPIDGVKPEALADGVNPKSIAGRLTRQRWNETRSGFNRRLGYQLLGVAWANTPQVGPDNQSVKFEIILQRPVRTILPFAC